MKRTWLSIFQGAEMSAGKLSINTQQVVAALPVPEWKWEVVSMDFITGLQ